MKKKLVLRLALIASVFTFVGCKTTDNQGTGSKKDVETTESAPANFEEAIKTSKGKTVTFYGFGGSEKANLWVDDVVTPSMKEKYDVTVKRAPMDIDAILTKLLNEKEAGAKAGDIDVIWINGENFYTAKQGDLLYGPFADKIESFNTLIDTKGHDANYDFGMPIEGYEVPYGNAQLVFNGDTDTFKDGFPTDTKALLDYAKKNPGKLTYTALPEFTGSAFVRNVICDIVGFDALDKASADKESLYKVIKPGLDYLNEIKPYLWQEGKTYPATTAELDEMFASGQIDMTYSYSQMHAAEKKSDKEFKDTVETFVFDKGTIANSNYLAISKNSGAKDAAMVLINEMISEEAQLKKAEAKYGYSIPPFDSSKLSDSSVKVLDELYKEKGVLSLQELQDKQIPEVSADKIAVIEELWKEHVLHE